MSNNNNERENSIYLKTKTQSPMLKKYSHVFSSISEDAPMHFAMMLRCHLNTVRACNHASGHPTQKVSIGRRSLIRSQDKRQDIFNIFVPKCQNVLASHAYYILWLWSILPPWFSSFLVYKFRRSRGNRKAMNK